MAPKAINNVAADITNKLANLGRPRFHVAALINQAGVKLRSLATTLFLSSSVNVRELAQDGVTPFTLTVRQAVAGYGARGAPMV